MQTTKNEKTTNDDLSGLFEIWEASYKAILGLLEKRKLNCPGLLEALNGINTQIFYFSAKNTEQILFKLRALADYFQEKDDRLACEKHLAPLQQRLENLGKTRVQAIPSEVAIAPASNLLSSSQSLHTMPSELCEKIASFLPADDVLKLAASSLFFSTTLCRLRQEALFSFLRISVGENYTLVHYLSGEVYGFGDNGCGQLGLGDTRDRLTPEKIPLLNKKIKQVVAGTWHTLILYEDGEVYGFGENYYGQLGLGDTRDRLTPEKIPLLSNKKVKQMVAGLWHTLILYEDGQVYGFGSNGCGQLGLGGIEKQCALKKIEDLPNKKAKQVVAGTWHTLILYEDGEVYGFGDNKKGQLGLGDTQYQHTPQKIPLPEGMRARQLAAGGENSFILCEDSKVLAFGKNFNGELGLGHTQVQNTPQEVISLPRSAQESTEKRCSRM